MDALTITSVGCVASCFIVKPSFRLFSHFSIISVDHPYICCEVIFEYRHQEGDKVEK